MGGIPSWVLPGAGLDFNFSNGLYFGGGPSSLTVTRASTNATDLLTTSASGYAYQTYGANLPRLSPNSGGLLVEEARTQLLAAPTVPATQTTASLGANTYTLWVNGSGSATSSAGTATITGAGVATNGTPNIFTVTVAGTVVVTVAGSLNAFQLEAGTWGTSFITTQAARNQDTINILFAPTSLSQYTLYAQGIPFAPVAFASNQTMVVLSDGTNNNRVQIFRQSADGKGNFAIVSGGVGGVAPFPNVVQSQNTSTKAAFSLQTSSLEWAADNGTALSHAAATLPVSITALNVGTQPNTVLPWNGSITRIAVLNNFIGASVAALTT